MRPAARASRLALCISRPPAARTDDPCQKLADPAASAARSTYDDHDDVLSDRGEGREGEGEASSVVARTRQAASDAGTIIMVLILGLGQTTARAVW